MRNTIRVVVLAAVIGTIGITAPAAHRASTPAGPVAATSGDGFGWD
jgi:hypothetical protein